MNAMKRAPTITGFVLFIALCVSTTYWAMQFFKPRVRPMIAPPATSRLAPDLSGENRGRVTGTAANNFQLTGIILADRPAESIAIIAANGTPARPFRVHAEIQAGVRVKEVQRDYVLLQTGEHEQRLELPLARK